MERIDGKQTYPIIMLNSVNVSINKKWKENFPITSSGCTGDDSIIVYLQSSHTQYGKNTRSVKWKPIGEITYSYDASNLGKSGQMQFV